MTDTNEMRKALEAAEARSAALARALEEAKEALRWIVAYADDKYIVDRARAILEPGHEG